MAVILMGTLDTKGDEIAFVRDRLKEFGIPTLVVDCGVLGRPRITADVSREAVFTAGGSRIEDFIERADRGEAIAAAARGARQIVLDLHSKGQVAGVLGLGGSAGTTIATAAMRSLPLGIPKFMVSTLASGQVRPFIGARDIVMMNSVTDISGINRISRMVLSQAAAAVAGMVQHTSPPALDDKPIITATMFGVTTPCVEACRSLLEESGYEVLVFHAVGTGGEAMESLVQDRLADGVLDITTTEWADELVGGVLSAGPDRLSAAARTGTPQVVSVGALDMVNFGPRATVPASFEGRQFYIHNDNVTLMRTTPDENRQLGTMIADKLRASTGPYRVLLPELGVSAIDREGGPFWNPEADQALFDAITNGLPKENVERLPCHINDPEFARAAVDALRLLISQKKRDR